MDDKANNDDIMPAVDRAREVMLKASWDYKVNIWIVAMLVSLP